MHARLPEPPGPTPVPGPPWPRPTPPLPHRSAPVPPLPSPGGFRHAVPVAGPEPVHDRLLDERIIYLGRDLDDATAERVIAQLLLLGAVDPRREITLQLSGTGGSAAAGLAVDDALRAAGPEVVTRAVGLVGTVGTVLLAAGTPGRRRVLPHARILLRNPSAGGAGAAGLGDELRGELVELLARHAGRPVAAVEADLRAQRRLTASEAVAYGLADAVVEPPAAAGGARR